jgi:Tfp pilus assembly protein PilF
LKQDPDSIRALKATALIYSAQNQPKQASTFLIEYLGQTKSAAAAQFVGQWLWSAGDHAQARAAFTRAKSLDPGYLPADLELARADLADGKIHEAHSALSRVVAADGTNFRALMLLADVESGTNNVELAIAHYRKALELKPDNGAVLNNLAYLLADKTDQTAEALKYAQQAVEAMPEDVDTMGTLGWALYRNGLYQQAQQQLQRASSKDTRPADPNAVIRKYHLAMAYLKVGERQKGLTTLSEALHQNPNLPEAMLAQAEMR